MVNRRNEFTSKKIVDRLKCDINDLQNKKKYRILYNFAYVILRFLLNVCIAVDYVSPFIISAAFIFTLQCARGNQPFKVDEIKAKPYVTTLNTSSGIHQQSILPEHESQDNELKHSTGWIKNDKGLYERRVTSYRLSDEIDLNNTEKIFSMSKEELEKILVITNIETIRKSTLTPDDEIYNEDAIIVINCEKSKDDTYVRDETTMENVLHSIWYIILVTIWGINITYIKEKILNIHFRDMLTACKSNFICIINKENLDKMIRLLKLKEENLAMVDENFDPKSTHR